MGCESVNLYKLFIVIRIYKHCNMRKVWEFDTSSIDLRILISETKKCQVQGQVPIIYNPDYLNLFLFEVVPYRVILFSELFSPKVKMNQRVSTQFYYIPN